MRYTHGMNKILILYFSGVGATRQVAEWMVATLQDLLIADIFSIEQSGHFALDPYDALIIGTPCFHAAPAQRLMDYFATLPPLPAPVPAFVFNTHGLYSCNTNRILAKALTRKNIRTIMDRSYRAPASDFTLLAPAIQPIFHFEKRIRQKIAADCAHFIQTRQSAKLHIPHFAFSSIFNAPNRLAGHCIPLTIHVHIDRCVQCGRCIQNCPHSAVAKDSDGYPAFNKTACENCYRCVHHCPALALSLSAHKKLYTALKYPYNAY